MIWVVYTSKTRDRTSARHCRLAASSSVARALQPSSVSGLVDGEAGSLLGLRLAVGPETAGLIERARRCVARQDPKSYFAEGPLTRGIDGCCEERGPDPSAQKCRGDVKGSHLADRGACVRVARGKQRAKADQYLGRGSHKHERSGCCDGLGPNSHTFGRVES